MKKMILVLPILLNACAYNSTMGTNDRFQVASTASFFAPSVTAVIDTKHPDALVPTFAGPSIVGQLANAAGNVAAGAFIGSGLKGSGTKVSQTGGGASSVAKGGNSSSLANGGQGGNSTSLSGAVSGSLSNAQSSSQVSTKTSIDNDVSVRIDD
jgi:hypothetical protein